MSVNNPYSPTQVMTDTLTMNKQTVLVIGSSGLGGGKNLTLPSASDCDDQNKYVVNKAASGGTITVAAAAGDTIIGKVTCEVARGLTLLHNSNDEWYAIG